LLFRGVAEGFDLDLDLASTPPPPPAVVSDATSLEHFRRHQELNHVPIIPRQIFSPFLTAAAALMPSPPMPTTPIPAFQPSFLYTFAPACSFQKELKRKWKNNEIEFQCACEKESVLSQRCDRTKHSNECKMKRLKESAMDLD
jgi:hypothetical protein